MSAVVVDIYKRPEESASDDRTFCPECGAKAVPYKWARVRDAIEGYRFQKRVCTQCGLIHTGKWWVNDA